MAVPIIVPAIIVPTVVVPSVVVPSVVVPSVVMAVVVVAVIVGVVTVIAIVVRGILIGVIGGPAGGKYHQGQQKKTDGHKQTSMAGHSSVLFGVRFHCFRSLMVLIAMVRIMVSAVVVAHGPA